MSEGESLYSFELYIHAVSDLLEPCVHPGFAFRLLDYPTVMIKWDPNGKDIGDQSENVKDKIASSRYLFEKGKSCLLKQRHYKLVKLLHKIPLYLMLHDECADNLTFVSSCSVPLVSLIKQISQSIEVNGSGCPAVAAESIKVKMFNLMGSVVCNSFITMKLNYFGCSLLKHVKLKSKKDLVVDAILDNKVDHDTQTDLNAEFYNRVEHHIFPADGLVTDSCNKNDICNAPKDITKAKPSSSNKAKRSQKIFKVKQNSMINDCVEGNFPPPLFYNASISLSKSKLHEDAPEEVVYPHSVIPPQTFGEEWKFWI